MAQYKYLKFLCYFCALCNTMLISCSRCKNHSLRSNSVFDNDIAPSQEKRHETKLLTFYRNRRIRLERDACFSIIWNTVVLLLSRKRYFRTR